MTISLTWTWNLAFFQLIPGLLRMLRLRLFCPQKLTHIRPVTASLALLPSPPKHTLEPNPKRSPLKSLSLWDYKKYFNLDTGKSRERIQLWSFLSAVPCGKPLLREGKDFFTEATTHVNEEGMIELAHPLSTFSSVNSVSPWSPTVCDPMDCSTPGLPVHHQLQELTHLYMSQGINWSRQWLLTSLERQAGCVSHGEVTAPPMDVSEDWHLSLIQPLQADADVRDLQRTEGHGKWHRVSQSANPDCKELCGPRAQERHCANHRNRKGWRRNL